MSTQRFCLCIALLASLWSSAAAATDATLLILTRERVISLSPDSFPSIPVSATVLAQAACEDPYTGDKAKCTVRVTNGPIRRQDNEQLPPIARYLLPEPVQTPCGHLGGGMTFGPTLVPEIPDAPGCGAFTGAFKINAHFFLTNLDTGQPLELELPVALSLAGEWSDSIPAGSKLLFRTYYLDGEEVPFEDCIPAWFSSEYDYEVVDGVCEECDELCAVLSAEDPPSDATPIPEP